MQQIKSQFRALVLLLFFQYLFVQTHAQTDIQKEIHLGKNVLTISNIFKQLEEKAGYSFIYSNLHHVLDKSIILTSSNLVPKHIFEQIAGQSNLRLTVNGNLVAVRLVGKGRLQGKVTTADGQPAVGVSVTLSNSLKGAVCDENGTFGIDAIPEGIYTVKASYAGLSTRQTSADIKESETTIINIVLSEDANTLQEVVVQGSHRNKFASKETEYVARMPLRNLENPQAYSVVNKELIQEQVVTDFEDAHKNVPGASSMKYSGGSSGLVMRGFITNGRARNGLDMIGIGPRDIATIESIEAIKGPSGALFGSLSTTFGGLINYVTKKPYDRFGIETSLTTGSYGLNRISADVNTPLNNDRTLLFRVNAALQSENSFQDQGYDKLYIFSPVLTYKASDRLTLSFETELAKQNRRSPHVLSFGSGFTGKSFDDIPLDYKRSLISNGVSNKTGQNSIYARADYKISSNWTSQTNFAWSEGYYDLHHSISLGWITDSSISRAISMFTPDRSATTQIQQNFIGDFLIGRFRNRMVAGISYSNYYQYRVSSSSGVFDTVNINKSIPLIESKKLDAFVARQNWNAQRTLTNMTSAYLSDVFNFTERLMVMLSLRVDLYDNKAGYNPVNGRTSEDFNQTALSPKLGIVYQPVKDKVALFANYMNGFKNVAPVNQPDGSTSNFEPQYANQWEGGVKLDIFNHKLIATISYYDIKVTNSTRPEVRDNQTFTVQDGTQRSKGYELDVISNPFKGLNIVAGYGNNENKFIEASASVKGKLATMTPRHIGNLWISYRLPGGKMEGFGVGIGGNYVGDSFYDGGNKFTLPSYTLLNTAVFFDRSRYRVSLKLNNLLNEQYWNTDGNAQKLRNFAASVTLKI